MVTIKNENEIDKMRKAGQILAQCFEMVEPLVMPGVSTGFLNGKIEAFLRERGGVPSFLGYGGFPCASCISPNDVVVHGIPSEQIVLSEGDIVGVDVGVCLDGWQADAARTFAVGKVCGMDKRLMDNAKECFFEGIKTLREGVHLGDLSACIQSHAEKAGYGIVRELCGHGIGKKLHEDPQIPNYGTAGKGPVLKAGMTLAIEPMITQGSYQVKVDKDKWTVRTLDGQKSAHYENTILVTKEGVEILTML
ncbi:MAG: type I methionyl aminopeptidase [Firmicutes bacterium]|nr:type I methionyl aminopeptidase [Bacillota bacterium]